MDASTIQEALVQHHNDRASGDIEDSLISSAGKTLAGPQSHSFSDVSGSYMATRFAYAASKVLSPQEYDQLLSFLQKNPDSLSTDRQEQLHMKIDTMLQNFYMNEISTSGWVRNRLCAPSGKEDAELVIVLHCQTRNGSSPAAAFWDTKTFTIRTLASKGYRTDFLYGFDWHWQAEETCIGRGHCSAAKWPPDVKILHDSMSASLFTTLPSRFALVGGDCARRHVRKVLDSSSTMERRSLSVPIDSASGMDVEFDFVFEHGGMRRIITYIFHPSTIYFEDPGGARSCSVQIEAASNFILWLLGKPHDPIAVQKLSTERVFDGHKAAPISEMRRYMALEKKEQKVLDEAGYHRAFLSRAKDYLGRDFDIALESNRSIAAACASKMNKMAWTARIKNYLAEEKRAQKRESDTEHQCLTKWAMHSRNTKGSEQKVGGPALDAEDDLSDSMDRRRQPSFVLTTSEFRYMQG